MNQSVISAQLKWYKSLFSQALCSNSKKMTASNFVKEKLTCKNFQNQEVWVNIQSNIVNNY